jgi:hypothetical protein
MIEFILTVSFIVAVPVVMCLFRDRRSQFDR